MSDRKIKHAKHVRDTQLKKHGYIPIFIFLCCCFAIGVVLTGFSLMHMTDNNTSSDDNLKQENLTTFSNNISDSNVDDIENVNTNQENVFANSNIADTPFVYQAVPTPYIASYNGIPIHSSIATNEIKGILFHQASYAYGLVMDTMLPVANEETYLHANKTPLLNVENPETPDGWVDAEALHLYRWQDNTALDTSIDIGADIGANVYAPVTGEVILVQEYLLYGYIPDWEIHIQPEGHPELDMVMLHMTDPQVEKGEKVIGGETVVAHVRDLDAVLDGIQLSDYSVDGTGNHSHIQLNDATWPGYVADKLHITPNSSENTQQAPENTPVQ